MADRARDTGEARALTHARPAVPRGPQRLAPTVAGPPPLGPAASPAAVMALQGLAGNAAVARLAADAVRPGRSALSCETASAPPRSARVDEPVEVQRGLLDDLSGGAAAVARAAGIIAEIAVNPLALPRLLSEVAWGSLPEAVKGRVVDAALRAIRVLVATSSTSLSMPPGPATLFAPFLKAAAVGAIDRVLAMDTTFKVRLVDRLVRLATEPTPDFALGYLIGFVRGVWDGVTGPFVLLYDLGRLGLLIQQAEMAFLARMADADERRQLVADAQTVAAKVQRLVEPLLADMMSGQSDPQALLRVLDRLTARLLEVAGGVGAAMADAFVRYLQKPDRELGEGVGWLTGTVAFEAALAYLTLGGYTAVKEALSGVRWIASAGGRLASAASEAAAALRPLLAALARFRVALAASPRGAAALEIVEDLYRLFLRYFEFSFGLPGSGGRRAEEGARAAAAGERVLASGERAAVRSERTVVNLLGEEHHLSLLLDGRIIRCSDRCLRIAESLAERAARLTGSRADTARTLVGRADDLARESATLAASGLPEAERAAREAALLARAETLERQMSGLERFAAREGAAATDAAERAMRAFDARGGRASLSAQDQAFLAADPRHPLLAFDPGGNGAYRVDEARAALSSEALGTLDGPVRRGYEPGADFVDGAGRPWSFKGTRPGSGADVGQVVPVVVAEARAGRSVVADLRHLPAADQGTAAAEIARQLTPPHAEIRFVPPVAPRIPGRS
jgi:hypothetical protein